MSALDDLASVVELACLTEDRTDGEQRALLRVARRIDQDTNANVVGNHRYWGDRAGSMSATVQRRLSTLERGVEASRVLDDAQREVRLKQKDTPAGRHRPDRCRHLDGGCGFPPDHAIHRSDG